MAEASTASIDERTEATAVSAAGQDAEDRLFVKRATVVYTAPDAPDKQVHI